MQKFNQVNPQIEEVIELAKSLQQTRKAAPSNAFADRMKPIIQSPESKHFLIRLMDVAFRSSNYARISAYVVRLFNSTQSHQNLFSRSEKILVRLYRSIGYKLPSVSIPAMLHHIRSVTSPILFFIGDAKFKKHTALRKKQGITLNVNLIGEALVGEKEADERIQRYCYLLNQPEVAYISIKISTLYSQIHALGYEYTLKKLVEKLSIIYDEVLKVEEKTGQQKFVNLDMEEYRDLSLSMDAFMQTLSLSKYQKLRAGIVLQAYLPDAANMMQILSDWAKNRWKKGGAPVKVRLVKGANLEMERTESSMELWPLATYDDKLDTDANFKKILRNILTPESTQWLHVGVASHNIFDLAYALTLVKQQQLEDRVDFEMLEGMANATVKELQKHGVSLILYTPIVAEEDYNSAIAYLVRRLDEGSQSGNFLKEGFNLKVGSEQWKTLTAQFKASMAQVDRVSTTPRRTQDRSTETYAVQTTFANVANTDWNLEKNRQWIAGVKKRWAHPLECVGHRIPLSNGRTITKQETIQLKAWSGTLPWTYELASAHDYQNFIDQTSEWETYSVPQRIEVLRKVAVAFAERRGDLIGVGVTELGKTVPELDVEVSEAIDFANYYAQSVVDLAKSGLEGQSGGVNLVLSPWNFPLAIPAGGVLASLAAGKRVILKPSLNAAACSYLICQAMWDAGIPRSALAFLPAHEQELDPFLSEGKVFDAVILTGGTDTAKFLLKRNPELNLYAETGGKNATIVTSLADREQAIKNVIHSAFGNMGQKCSATSLLVLEKEVFEDQHFKKLLKDATESKLQGSPWEFENQWGPLSVPVSEKILTILEEIPDEKWLVKPRLMGDFWLSPGIIWDVKKTDKVYSQELFGPILAVMQAKGLADAVQLVNGVPYGLTSGIESLAREEIWYWQDVVEAGNLYANRSTTGAIVQRQPFGGMKASSFGLGMKAGGPNYVLQFMTMKSDFNEDMETIFESYQSWYADHFNQSVDYAKIRGQHNINRYLFPNEVFCLIDAQTPAMDVAKVAMIAKIMRKPLRLFALEAIPWADPDWSLTQLSDWNALKDLLDHKIVLRNFVTTQLSEDFLLYCHMNAYYVNDRRPSNLGRIEWLNYVQEQNRSINYHRYGNLLGEEPFGS